LIADSLQSLDRRISLDAAIGPSFANLGTTLSATADLNLALDDRTSLVGEFGMLRHAAFDEAAAIAPRSRRRFPHPRA
jgi:hypothetical protein